MNVGFETELVVDEEKDEVDENIGGLTEFDISSAPNDFNIMTLYNYVDKGVFKIPGFQRNYVWDIKRASALIESVIIGLPIPQIFLYQVAKDKFDVIDGQQRLMSIYYFIKGRFPLMKARPMLRSIMMKEGNIPDSILKDKNYFEDFDLVIPPAIKGHASPLNGKNFFTLGDYSLSFEMKTIRNVIIRQSAPNDGGSSVYEIFKRLNTGGIILAPQEIRTSIYHGRFYEMLDRINLAPAWRMILGLHQPDLHMKDMEVVLRGFSMLISGEHYSPSMTRFLNKFSFESKGYSAEKSKYYEELFLNFSNYVKENVPDAFMSKTTQRFNISIFDSLFAASCEEASKRHDLNFIKFNKETIDLLKSDVDFLSACQSRTASKAHVQKRLAKARQYLASAKSV